MITCKKCGNKRRYMIEDIKINCQSSGVKLKYKNICFPCLLLTELEIDVELPLKEDRMFFFGCVEEESKEKKVSENAAKALIGKALRASIIEKGFGCLLPKNLTKSDPEEKILPFGSGESYNLIPRFQ